MSSSMVGVTLHINEDTTHGQREVFRDVLLELRGVMAAAYHDDKPHLLVIEYDPEIVNSMDFVETAKKSGFHAQLIGI